MVKFNSLIEELDLVDIPVRDELFSRSIYATSKLDRFLVLKPWIEFFKEIKVHKL